MREIPLLFILLSVATVGYAARGNLYEMFNDYSEIKVFLKDVIDETGDPRVETEVFREVFEDVITSRINIKFMPVDSREDADVIINTRIKDYSFTKRALPIRAAPLFINAVTLVADTAEPKSAAKLVVDYEIRRSEDNKALFSYKNLTTEARKPQQDMKEEMGFIYAAKENINRFIFRAFYKRGKR
jgi:hypothetical protein